MLDVDSALSQILAAFSPLPAISLPLPDALNLVLAGDVMAAHPVPPFRNSAMDGFAVHAGDTAAASWRQPVALRVVAEIAAGDRPGVEVRPGEAARIMTGAVMPSGADAVIRFEETDEESRSTQSAPRTVRIFHPAKRLDNVREAGEDIRQGAVVAGAGQRLSPPTIGLIASVGGDVVPVHRRPRIAILSTGSELTAPGQELKPGMIRDSNSYVIGGMARSWGATVEILGIADDSFESLQDHLTAADGVDLIVTSGGVSLGDFDLVKDVLRAEGDVAIWQVRMKPGKPLAFGRIGQTPLLGLPGNPVAAAVSFLVFGRPAIRRMLGWRDLNDAALEVKVVEPIDNRGQRRHFARVTLTRDEHGDMVAYPTGDQGAGVLSSLARADALLVVPEELERVEPGTKLQAIPFDW